MTGRERFLAAVHGESTDSLLNIPITMMKAADAVRVPYKRYALDAEAHAAGQIAIARTYDIDHVSGISDPAVEAADLGATVIYRDDAPPAIDDSHTLLADKTRLATLKMPDPRSTPRMGKRIDVVARLHREVGAEKAVEGWIEGPIAQACDLRGMSAVMIDFFDDPPFIRDLTAFVFEMEIAFARAQVEAGADYIGVGDAAASLIGPDLYREFAWEHEKRYVREIHRMGVPVRLHICGNITALLPLIREVGADLLDLDSMVSVSDARREVGADTVLSGNINPVAVVRDGSPTLVTDRLEECLADAGSRRYAVAAGCEIPRDSPDANLHAMTRFARSHRAAG